MSRQLAFVGHVRAGLPIRALQRNTWNSSMAEGEKHGKERGHRGTARMLSERVEVQTCCLEEFLI
tara:strand:+ start:417 stop:611 length:195 start_codon:yes stop_codon:yes gene_type:complete